MTDKQIIIDGIDVSGCINFRPDVDTAQISYTNACSIGIWQRWYSNLEPSCIMSCSCKYNPNCYYKQLKRKEQECEKLKEDLIEAKAHGDYLNNLALSETLNLVSEQLDQLKAENEILEKDKANLAVITETLKVQFKQLKQTLTEIKEIAEHCQDPADKENDGFWTILQKIKECELDK